MLYGVGVYHPQSGKYNQDIVGYDLQNDQLSTMDVAGLPLTVEHNGIVTAVKLVKAAKGPLNASTVGAALDLLSETSRKSTVVGYVQKGQVGKDGRWYCSFALDEQSYPVIPMLIKCGALGGLSMTHYHEKQNLTPLEISLCTRPARPECMIGFIGNQEVQQEYLRVAINRGNTADTTMAAMKETPIVAASAATEPEALSDKEKLERFIENMPEEGRKLITAKFKNFLDHINNEKKRATEAAERAETAEFKATEATAKASEASTKMEEAQKNAKNAAINLDLFDSTIRMMAQQLNPELKEAYIKDPSCLMEEARNGNMASFVNATTNLLVACSIHMRDGAKVESAPMETTDVHRPNKRKASESLDEKPEPSDPLSAALSFSFNNESHEIL